MEAKLLADFSVLLELEFKSSSCNELAISPDFPFSINKKGMCQKMVGNGQSGDTDRETESTKQDGFLQQFYGGLYTGSEAGYLGVINHQSPITVLWL